jgi:hypothetical protein
MGKAINNGKGITIYREQVRFPIKVENKIPLTFHGREASLCIVHDYVDGDYYVSAHVEVGGRAYHAYDGDVDGTFAPDWEEAVRDLFRGCFMNGVSSIVLPDYFVEMVERMLGDLDFLTPAKAA